MKRWIVPLLAGQIALLLPAAYWMFLTLVGLLHRAPPVEQGRPNQTRLAVLVPAHDEEAQLPRLLNSLGSNDYPRERYDVFVVADNCTDNTAAVARGWGASVHERHDAERIGKGYALEWLLDQIRDNGHIYDGYVFLDADCEVSSNFLSAMSERLAAGEPAVQAYYTVADPFTSSVSALRYAAMVLKHYTRPRGRAVLGLPCGLFGTGMAFSKEIIQRHGWSAHSLTEDLEYQLRLADEDTYVIFAPEASVTSPMPSSFSQARSQNVRWERGRLRLILRWGPSLIRDAILRRAFRKLDIFSEQAAPPLSVIAFSQFMLVAIAMLFRIKPLALLSLSSTTCLAIHVVLGLISAKAPARTYLALLSAPVFVLWKLQLYAIALLPGKERWIRTRRS
ncbi:MAG: glycosyltransferase family 2 protein [Dehalococcoidia bacterium]